ncbi:MobA/MobL family protein [Magnetospirillum sp. ME-1]|uniref:MobA/MobL family protein n=1 Tax=Magnetospirillum sp. ME-1 TaxID=1639348 RepID=UPI00143CDDA5|nr:MobA/MobL family protein [Magnetospirillum sp. ME-1]
MEVRIIGGRSATGAAAYRSTSTMTSALAAAAYRACDRLDGTRAVDGIRQAHTWDYSSKTGLAWSEILIPARAPDWMRDRQRLWSAVDAKETRKDAQYARELLATLPRELPLEAAIAAFRSWVSENVVALGMVADICVHAYGTALDPRKPEQARRLLEIVDPAWPIYDMPTNGMTPDKIPDGPHVLRYPNGMLRVYQPHAHVMLTMRSLTKDGFGNKERSWNRQAQLYAWRQGWEGAYNALLAAHGSSEVVQSKAAWKREMDAAHDAGDDAEVERLSQTFSPRAVDAGGGYYAALDGRPPHDPNQFQVTPMDFNKALQEQKVRTQRALQDQDDMYAATELELVGELRHSQKEAAKAKAENEQMAEQLTAAETERDHAIVLADRTTTKVRILGDLLTEAAQQQQIARSDAEGRKQKIQVLEIRSAELEAKVSSATADLESIRRQAEAAQQAQRDEKASRARAERELREQTILLDDMADYVTGAHKYRPRIADDATAIGRLMVHAEDQGKRLQQAETAIKGLADGVSHLVQSVANRLAAKLGNWLIERWNRIAGSVRGDSPLVAHLLPPPLTMAPATETSGAPTNPPTPTDPERIKAAPQAQDVPVPTRDVPSRNAEGPMWLAPTATRKEREALRAKLGAMDNMMVWAIRDVTLVAAEEAEAKGDRHSGYHLALAEIDACLGMLNAATATIARASTKGAAVVSPAVSVGRPLSGSPTNPAETKQPSRLNPTPPKIPPAAQLPKAKSANVLKPPAR